VAPAGLLCCFLSLPAIGPTIQTLTLLSPLARPHRVNRGSILMGFLSTTLPHSLFFSFWLAPIQHWFPSLEDFFRDFPRADRQQFFRLPMDSCFTFRFSRQSDLRGIGSATVFSRARFPPFLPQTALPSKCGPASGSIFSAKSLGVSSLSSTAGFSP